MFAVKSPRHEELARQNEQLGNLREENTRLRAEVATARSIADAQAARANAASNECDAAIEVVSKAIAEAQSLRVDLSLQLDLATKEATESAYRAEAMAAALGKISALATPEVEPPATDQPVASVSLDPSTNGSQSIAE